MANEKTMNEAKVSRRNLLHVIGTLPAATMAAAPALAEHAGMSHGATHPPMGPYKRQTFNDQQYRTVSILCDLIIPADDRSGNATSAGVPDFIDDWIAFQDGQHGNQNLQARIFGGLIWLDRESKAKFSKPFADAAAEQQKQILDRVAWPAKATKEDAAWVAFFSEFRDLTVSGFFSSKAGVKDLQYLGNTAVPVWKGCDPKVWAVIESRMKNGYKSQFLTPAEQSTS